MQLFVDTANLAEIRAAAELGVISGVTTNPTLLARNGAGHVEAVIRDICALVDGPVSMECVSEDCAGMVAEGRRFRQWGENVYVKVPFCVEGIKAVHQFSQDGIPTNVTLVFSANQALLAASAGATLISSFVGRLDDIGFDGIEVIAQTVALMETHRFASKVLAASIRHPLHVTQAAEAGAHIATIPFDVLKKMYHHPLTEKGIAAFTADWQALQGAAAS